MPRITSFRTFGLLAVGVLLVVGLGIALFPLGAKVSNRQLHVAAAGDLRHVLDELAGHFHQAQFEIRVRISYGASGTLYAQIGEGAPFDLFFSADEDYPRSLI